MKLSPKLRLYGPLCLLSVLCVCLSRSGKIPRSFVAISLLFLLFAPSVIFSAPAAKPQPDATSRCNILLIIADDMGYSDLGCYGGEIDTPNLDALAAGGLRFTNFYVNNMCWPTRASLMTGLYPTVALPKNGSAEGGLHPDAATLPESLRDAGYRTLMSGKWHLSNPNELDGPNAPHHRGFDRYYGIINGAASFYAPFSLTRDGKDASADFKDNPDYYFTDAVSDEAIRMLEEHMEGRASSRPRAEGANAGAAAHPFFCYVSYTAAHWPLHAEPADIAAYKGRFAKGWDKLRKQRHARMIEMGLVDPEWKLSPRHPDVPAWEDAEDKEWQERRMEVYAAQITSMDRGIGRILDYLRESGQFDNTLVLYQHDNGACHVEYGEDRKGNYLPDKTRDGRPMRPGNIPGLMPGPEDTYQSYGYGWANLGNTPFRLFKQHDHEGGTRSPLIVSWPAGIDHDIQGGLAHEVCHAIDVMPTLLDAAQGGRASSRPQPKIPFEGISFLSAITPDVTPTKPRDALFWSHAQGSAVRRGDWKLVRTKNNPWELYDLYEDGTELHDLAAKMPERVAELESRFQTWAKANNAIKPKKKKKGAAKGK